MQTLGSASLAVLLAVPASALADADAEPAGEARPPTGTFEIGAGYSTDDELMFLARVAQPSLFGTDKQLSLTSMLTARRHDFTLSYVDPTLFGALRLRGDLYARTKHHPGFTREAYGGALSLTRRIAPHLDAFVGYRGEHVQVEPNDLTLAMRGGAPQAPLWRGGFISAVRAGIAYDSRDGAFYPRRGTLAGASIEIADRQLGSELAYTRTDAWLGHHRPLGPFTLHLGGRVSTITDVPLSERLHFDGSSDIRGYAPGEIGPKDPVTGLPTGGNLLWSARGELEAPLIPAIDLSVAGFLDVGGLHANGGAGETAAAAGFGLIWRSPIGPLRFDWAFPLGRDGGPRFVFGIGGVF